MRMRILAVAAFLTLLPLVAVGGAMPVPRLTEYVTDMTGTLPPESVAALNRKLLEFDRSTSTQVVVLIVPTTGDLSVEEASLAVAEKNSIGKKGRDNGVLLFIARNDRKIRIEVGYGLEGALPDIIAGQIIRKEISPRFREGDFAGGVDAGVEAILQATRHEYQAENPRSRRGPGGLSALFVLIVAIAILAYLRRGGGGGMMRGGGYRRPYGTGGVFFPMGGGWSGGSSGGGWSGGGFSGGGGSFGGGGASGGW